MAGEAGWLLTICCAESRAVELGAGACGCRESISRGAPKGSGEPELRLDSGDWEEGCPRKSRWVPLDGDYHLSRNCLPISSVWLPAGAGLLVYSH